ncbi:MAG: hypothetical protein M5R40_12995 [Anaerolineae bacterium]|nr:hypothetical protein [Anaerolineae bacterium]
MGMVTAPGGRFAYGPSHLFAFGELMRRKLEPLGEDPLDYLKQRVFAPIGLEVYAWRRDAAGNPYLPSGAFLSARAWARYGVLLRDEGAWAGAPVLPAAQLAECFAGSDANPGYGLTFWLNHDVPEAAVAAAGAQGGLMQPGYLYEGGPPDLVMAAGAGNQRMYIIPSRDLVVVRFGWNDPSWDDAAFLARLLEGRVSD